MCILVLFQNIIAENTSAGLRSSLNNTILGLQDKTDSRLDSQAEFSMFCAATAQLKLQKNEEQKQNAKTHANQ